MGVIEARRRILLNQPHLIDVSGNPIAFQTDMAAKMGVKAYFSPVQEGTGDPSPSNVRPISGWTGCEVYRTGKNLFTSQNEAVSTIIIAGGQTEYDANWNASDYIPISGNTTYRFETNSNGSYGARYAFYNANKECINSITAIPGKFTTPADARYARFSYAKTSTNIQLALGSTATTYEPYSGAEYPVTFPSEAGTLYGGYVDYERGEVVAEYYRAIVTSVLNVWNETLPNTVGGYLTSNEFNIPADKITNGKLISDYLPRGGGYGNDTIGVTFGGNRYLAVRLPYTVLNGVTHESTASEKKAAMDVYLSAHPLHVVYELATPITYPLTPTLIKSLKGANTVWSDMNGNLEIGYWKH